jgi:hypothetical protein
MFNNKLRNGLLLLSLFEGLNYLLMEPYLLDPYIFEEFVSNSLIIFGICLATTQNLNPWIILVLVITWIGIVGLFVHSDLEFIEEGNIKTILKIKIIFIKSFWSWIGIICFGIIARSVYYDGILVILSLFHKRHSETVSNTEFINV